MTDICLLLEAMSNGNETVAALQVERTQVLARLALIDRALYALTPRSRGHRGGRSYGLQTMAVLKLLNAAPTGVTANDVLTNIPEISRARVYGLLAKMCERGQITRVAFGRYRAKEPA